MYTDSHCHITCDELFDKLPEVLAGMEDVSRYLIICTSETEFRRAREIKKLDSRARIAFGFYPGDVQQVDADRLAFLEDAFASGDVDVAGEIGLDYYWTKDNKEEQKELFIRQLQLAGKYGLPVAIHMRSADQDTLDILKQYAKTKIIFHCFSSSAETMRQALQLDSLISFAGPITYKNAKHGPACVRECPADRMLTETDSPYLAPVPMRGRRNEPGFVRYTTKKICELKELDEASFCTQIAQNFDGLFQDHPAG